MNNAVSLVRSTYQTAFENLSRGIQLVGGFEGLKSGAKVVIKINICDARTPETGAITHPLFLDALLKYLRENYESLEIYVAESDATVVFADKFIRWFGYLPVLEKWDANWQNLSKGEIIEIPVPNGHYFSTVPVPKILKESYFISLSKLKTNSLSSITCSLKNQFGCLPMAKKSVFHNDLAKVITDVNFAMLPDFCIVDGIISHGSARGPAFGIPIKSNLIVFGRNPVSVDAVCAEILGFKPKRIEHIKLAHSSGLGDIRYNLAGDPIPQVDFEIDRLDILQMKIAKWIRKMHRNGFRHAWRRK